MILGGDGGLYISFDASRSWEHVHNLPIGQFYGIGVDMRKPYRIYGGLQDNGSWGGPSQTRSREGITPADWFRYLGGDGFHAQVEPTDPDTLYAEGQFGYLHRINTRTAESVDIRPHSSPEGVAYRYNWSSPILLSPHSPGTVYYGGNHLFRSRHRGDLWNVISPDLTHGQPGPARTSAMPSPPSPNRP